MLVGAGFSEAYTWTLVPADGEPEALAVPVHDARSAALRTTSCTASRGGRAEPDAGVERIALFEIARVFLPSGEELPEERWHVAGITEGGFFRAKGAVEALHRALGELRFERESERPLPGHGRADDARPHRRAPPDASRAWGVLRARPRDAARRRVPEPIAYEDVITYPAVKQDLAFVVDESVTAGDLVAAAREAAGPELRELRVFDVYRGEQVGEGKKSIALARRFQSPERTLSDEDAAGAARADRRRARRALRRRAARLASQSVPLPP